MTLEALAVDFSIGSHYVHTPSGARSGAATWDSPLMTRKQFEVGNQRFNIFSAVHNGVPAEDAWKAGESADLFNVIVEDMLSKIYSTKSGKRLLDKYVESSGFQLHIFEMGSEPVEGRAELGIDTTRSYVLSVPDRVAPENVAQQAERTSLSVDSARGVGASTNLAIRKEDVFEYNKNPSKILRDFTEELVHSHRAAWGVSAKRLKGLDGFEVVPHFGVNYRIPLETLIEELEVAGEFPFPIGNDPIVANYKSIFIELRAKYPELKLNFDRVGEYAGLSGLEWLERIRFQDGIFFGTLNPALADKPKSVALAAMQEIEDWVLGIERINSANQEFVRRTQALSRKITAAKRSINATCSTP